jgi:hypothetical protein
MACPPPVSFSPEAQEALVACIQDNKRKVYEREADAMVEAFLPLDEVPKQCFSVPGDDDDEHDHLDNVEKWEIAKLCRVETLDPGNVSGIYVSADRKVEIPLACQLREKLLAEYADTVFRPQIYCDPPERVLGGVHTIKLKEGVQPVYQHPFQLAGDRRKAMEDVVQQWIDAGKIERPTKHEGWGAAVFPIPKKSGEWRGISDHRGLNERVQRDNYPLPLIEGILERKGRCKMFSKLDLKDAFSQVPLSPECRHLTTINTPWVLSNGEFCRKDTATPPLFSSA